MAVEALGGAEETRPDKAGEIAKWTRKPELQLQAAATSILFSIHVLSFNSNDDHRHTQKNGGGEDERTEAYRPSEEERQAGGVPVAA